MNYFFAVASCFVTLTRTKTHSSNRRFVYAGKLVGASILTVQATGKYHHLLAVASLVTIRKAQFGTYSWATSESHGRPLIIVSSIMFLICTSGININILVGVPFHKGTKVQSQFFLTCQYNIGRISYFKGME